MVYNIYTSKHPLTHRGQQKKTRGKKKRKEDHKKLTNTLIIVLLSSHPSQRSTLNNAQSDCSATRLALTIKGRQAGRQTGARKTIHCTSTVQNTARARARSNPHAMYVPEHRREKSREKKRKKPRRRQTDTSEPTKGATAPCRIIPTFLKDAQGARRAGKKKLRPWHKTLEPGG